MSRSGGHSRVAPIAAAERKRAQKKDQGATTRGRIVGVIRANDSWMFVVQAFSTASAEEPIYCRLLTAEQLKGSVRKKADRWASYLDNMGKKEAA